MFTAVYFIQPYAPPAAPYTPLVFTVPPELKSNSTGRDLKGLAEACEKVLGGTADEKNAPAAKRVKLASEEPPHPVSEDSKVDQPPSKLSPEKGEAGQILRLNPVTLKETDAIPLRGDMNSALVQAKSLVLDLVNVVSVGENKNDATRRARARVAVEPTLKRLQCMESTTSYKWKRGKSTQMIIHVLSFGDPERFAIDWHTKCKNVYPFWCFDGAVIKFTYSTESVYLISRVEGDVHEYMCLPSNPRAVEELLCRGFFKESTKAISAMADELYEARVREAGIEHAQRSTLPQSNYIRPTNKEDYQQVIWHGMNRQQIMPRMEAELARVKLPMEMKVAQLKRMDRLFSSA
jgi:hypothetical protein